MKQKKQEQLTKLSKLDEFDEEVIRYLVDYVMVYDNEHIEIRWNFALNKKKGIAGRGMKREYQITVNDSVFRTKRWELHAVILFVGCFLLQFLLYSLLGHTGVIQNPKLEAYMPEAVFITSFLVTCIYYWIREMRTHGRMKLDIAFLQDSVRLFIKGKEYQIPYDTVSEVSKIMVIDRTHDQKGCYRMKIKCHGRSNLEFETTQQEYEKHLDFEETELFLFYDACRQAGLKCC